MAPSDEFPSGSELTSIETESSNAPVSPKEMPLPQDARTVFQGGLFVLAVLAAAYVAKVVLLPIILAFILKLLVQPVMRLLARIRMPRVLASLTVIVALLGLVFGLVELLSAPAAHWATKLPEGLPRLQERVKVVSAPLNTLSHLLTHAKSMMGNALPNGTAASAAAPGMDLQGMLLEGAQTFTAEFLTTFLVLFFLLMSGDTFLRRLVEVMPSFKDKRQVADISSQIETDISMYLVTITVMNALVGIATGCAMWALGLEDAFLWGAIAFLLNYVPILGPLTGVAIFLGAGMLSLEPLWKAFMPVVLYGAIHIIEGETITPMLLARRFTLNPVLVIISLLFWDWMWGTPGAVLAVPMLAILKIVCDRVRPLAALGHFLEGEKQALES
ncbi:MAG TPA: AI-2E family transporter [Dyella sp.]|uniref:AI-2E family transporter n=1 Tax=Dyella sp. TaxID=1869338 RepID=UPI002D773A1B|nr:AI-2E family transporter [Dyella sp.]HET6552354.1 AI-2E family transporter [Dyella sp.]